MKLAYTTALAVVAITPVMAGAQTIYDNLDSGTDGVAFTGDLVLDDLHVEGGGLLQQVTLALTATGSGGGTVVTDVQFSLAVDGGDGFPDLDGTGDDAVLFQALRPAVEVAVGGLTEVTIDVSSFYSLVPEDALLFGGVGLSNPAVGHVFYGSPTIGSTDGLVFSFQGMGPVPVPSVTDPKLENSDGLAFRIEVVPLPPVVRRSGVLGDPITFNSLPESTLSPSETFDGVTFSEARDGFPPPFDLTFGIDDGTGVWAANPGMLEFVDGSLLTFGGYSGGPDGFLFTACKSVRITPDAPRTGARVNVAYVAETFGDGGIDYSDATITLLALSDGVMVASRSINADNVLGTSSGGTFDFGAGAVEISGIEFDDLVLFTNSPGTFGYLLMALDNVLLGTATCLGDLDVDGEIGFPDLLVVLSTWGPCDTRCDADLDGDGHVGFSDLLLVLSEWGPCA